MADENLTVTVSLRIPGLWSGPKELLESLPAGHRLTPDTFSLPDGTTVDFAAARADDQLRRFFDRRAGSRRRMKNWRESIVTGSTYSSAVRADRWTQRGR